MATNTTPFFQINTTTTINTTREYIAAFPESIMRGEVPSIILGLIILFLLILIINEVSKLLLAFLKRTIIFIIVALVIYDFLPKYLQILQTEGASAGTIFMGIGAILFSGAGLFVASRALVRSAKTHIADWKFKKDHYGKLDLKHEDTWIRHEDEPESAHTENIKQIFSKESLNSDKSLIMVLVYLIVAEFGVFSSPTLSAPNIKTGLMFFGIFLVGIFMFVGKAYKNIKIGYLYLAATFIVGIVFSFILGYVWGNVPLSTLLSLEFFQSDSLIALITGMSVSLFAGSKG